ncbi:MAG: FAD-binding protein [Rhodobacteraceae bacterium]|nr:FAD-binding protein [Paracoccaceae bacterium]
MGKHAAAIAGMKALLGDRLSTSPSAITLHARDEAHYPDTPPDAVAFPKTVEEVSDVVNICARHGCPVVPWGAGTSLEGHALPIRGGVTVDTSLMRQVVHLWGEDLCCAVQPGITREELNTELRTTGLFFPIDPGANATIGGMTATNASGTMAVRYGTMKDNVMGVQVVLADGRIIRTGTRAKKSSSGYDLTRLLVGSEGTLGIITEITLRLQGQPEAISAAVCPFPDVRSVVNSVIRAVQMGLPAARMELVDAVSIKAINSCSDLSMAEVPHLFMEFHGSEAGVAEDAERMAEIVADNGGNGFKWATKAEDRTRLWHARHNAYFAMKSMKPGSVGISTDVCVPISSLARAIEDTIADVEAHGWTAPIVGHVGDGNYHTLFLFDPKNEKDRTLAMKLTHRMNERALALDGTVTGEHGIGIGKMEYMAAEHGEAVSVMAAVKRALDPEGIMNPGKVVEVN